MNFNIRAHIFIYIVHIKFGYSQIPTGNADLHTLKFVHVISRYNYFSFNSISQLSNRHGDRAPRNVILTDTQNNASTWKEGFGELTKLGALQSYEIGQFLRKRYNGFLSESYSPYEVYLRSSDYNRTLMSAQAIAAGLYPPNKNELFLSELNWRPIPVHTKSKENDNIVFDFQANCALAIAEFDRILSSEEFNRHNIENKEFLTFIAQKSGFPKIPIPFSDLWLIYDILLAEFTHSEEHKWPDWVNETVYAKIKSLYHIYSRYQLYNEQLKGLLNGPLFSEILERMKSNENGSMDSRLKIFLYVGHEITVAGILEILGINLEIYPEYSSFAILELHHKNSNYFVKLFYKNDTKNANLWEYEIPNCGPICTLDILENSRRKLIPIDWKTECGNVAGSLLTRINLVLAAICTGVVLYTIVLHMWTRNSIKKNSNKVNIKNENARYQNYEL